MNIARRDRRRGDAGRTQRRRAGRPKPRPSAARLMVALVTTAITLARAFTRRTLVAG